ncbi:MAG TPA: hypothetical protein VIU93_03145 [Gallionellaceae bacterium]
MHIHDSVFWGVILCFGGAALVLAWLGFVIWRNANRKDGQK